MAWALRLMLLAGLLAKAESPVLRPSCADGEYLYAGQFCCRSCPAGTHVDEHCITPHTLGSCTPCTEGEDYTEYENGLDQCLPCHECKSGFVMVRPCTVKNNMECQCPEGYYCPPGCEECIKCKKKCREGQMEVHSCSPTRDRECKPYPTGTTDSTLKNVFIIIGVFVFVFAVVVFIYRKRNSLCKREKEKEAKECLMSGSSEVLNTRREAPAAEGLVQRNEVPPNVEGSNLRVGNTDEASTSENVPSAPLLQQPEESAIPSVQSNVTESKKPVVRVINSTSKELTDIYFATRNIVPTRYWNELMRKSGLSNNDIEKIKQDNPNHIDEAYYEMLTTIQDRIGIDGALCKLLDGLWDLNLKAIYENVTNELISHNILILETKD